MRDKQLGISIRFVKEWVGHGLGEMTVHDQALMLVMNDTRDVPAVEKLADAYEFLRQRVRVVN